MRHLAWVGGAMIALLSACSGPAGEGVIPGVDLERKLLRIGMLNDESGPAAVIGRPYAIGKRVLAAEINRGGSGLLPEGWRVELIERDHGYNPQRSVQTFNEIREQVLFFGTSFGTPNTLPLLPMQRRHNLVVFPASSASKLMESTLTPASAPPYRMEAMRALDFAVEQAGGAGHVRAGIVYQHDDYGQDCYDGWLAAARYLGVEVVARETYMPGQADFTATVIALRRAGATHVLLATVPGATATVLGTAAQLNYSPAFLAISAAWVDRFFDPRVVPAGIFRNFHWVSGQRYIGERFPAMERFLKAHADYPRELPAPDLYMVASYVQGRVGIEAFRRALEAGDPSRAGFRAALATLTDFNAEGALNEPPDYSREPYSTGRQVRVLRPDFTSSSWTVVSDYTAPQAP